MSGRPVPGKPTWHFSREGISRSRYVGTGEKRREIVEQVIDWCPTVERYVVGRTVDGDPIRTRYTVRVGDQVQTFSQDDLRDGRAWDNFRLAAGQGDKQVAGALADIVRYLGRDLGETLDCPVWEGDRLVMPPGDLMPDGYQLTDTPVPARLLGIAEDNPKLALALGFAYGAPYVAPLGRQAFVVHLPGTAGQGKTTGMWAAASLWGRPSIGGALIPSWNTTQNAVYARLGHLAVVPAFYDDLHAAGFNAADLKKLIMSVTQGGGRGRSDRHGDKRPSRSWSGVLFSTGNMSILGMLGTAGEFARRVVEIPAPIVKNGETARTVKALAQEHFGHFRPVPVALMGQATLWAEKKLAPVIGPDPSGVTMGILECVALGVAGAWHLGGEDLCRAALMAARAVLADQVAEAIEAGSTTGEKLMEAARQIVVSRSLFPTREERKTTAPERRQEIHGFYEAPDLYVMTQYIGTIASLAGLTDAAVALRELKASGHLITQQQGAHLRRQFRVGSERFSVYHLRLGDDGPVMPGPDGLIDIPYEAPGGGVSGVTGVTAGQSGGALTPVGGVSAPGGVTAGQSATAPAQGPAQGAPMGAAGGVIAGQRGDTTKPAVVPAPRRVRECSGVTAPCVACGDPADWYKDGQPCHVGCDVPRPPRPAPVQEEIPPAPIAEEVVTGGYQPTGDRPAPRLTPAAQLTAFSRAVLAAWPDHRPEPTAEDLAAGLAAFSEALDGLAWGRSPGTTGQWLFQKLEAQYGAVPVLGTPPTQPDFGTLGVAARFDALDQSATVSPGSTVASWDVNAQFLGPLGGLELGTGEPVAAGAGTFTKKDLRPLKLPGYVQLAEDAEVWTGCTVAAGRWVPAPVAVYLVERLGTLAVTARWEWPEHRRWLALWGRRVTAARTALMARGDVPSQVALVALKTMYAKFLGGWLASGPTKGNHNRTNTLRPDWMHMIHSAARMNAFRALAKTSPQPFCVSTDTAYFLLPEGHQPEDGVGLTVSTQVGKWKRAESAPADRQGEITRNGRARVTTLQAEIATGRASGVVALVHDLHKRGPADGA